MTLGVAIAQVVGIASLAVSSTAAAVAQRTFVKSTGVDSNPCTIALPCRSFAVAIASTSPAGEVIVLDSAGYGIVTITQSVTIAAPPGVYAGIFVTSGNIGVTVDGPGILVTLRGLTINGQGGGFGGIVFQQGSRLNVDHCLVANVNGHGLRAIAIGGQVFVSDSTFRYASLSGISVQDGKATIDRARLENNGESGVWALPIGATTEVTVQVRDSVASGNNSAGFRVNAGSPGQVARLTVERSSALRNEYGFFASGVGTDILVVADSAAMENASSGLYAAQLATSAMVSGSTLARNGAWGIEVASPAVVISTKSNAIELNGSGDVSGVVVMSALK